ncbi:uncharacterized protein LOC121776964 [Salvia splendens]|uniref:uncharacterized protein LOC121776964 n=1 Tax=Salvia splendens TaxID=180675 RepID=UPI001C2750D8|nr:uncharacterized protein LOC121776964 [Salvia splendens]
MRVGEILYKKKQTIASIIHTKNGIIIIISPPPSPTFLLLHRRAPPTPSSSSDLPSSTSSDLLSNLLHRLPPSLSLPTTRRPSPLPTTTTPPSIPLSALTPSNLLHASTEFGFFHLTHHPIPSDLPLSAESTALSLLSLPRPQKQLLFPSNWPFGHEIDDDEDGEESLCLDPSLSDFRDFAAEMERLGLKVLEELASAVGFDNPTRNQLSLLLWISDAARKPGRVYPYAVGLHYQIRTRKQTLLTDSGRVTVSGLADSVLVTVGDIAQVWSNGKLKKVRGRPFPCSFDDFDPCINMSLLITLPAESVVRPLLPNLISDDDDNNEGDANNKKEGEKRLFNSFSLEDYAWRIYHQPLLFKDPLLRYRTRSSSRVF